MFIPAAGIASCCATDKNIMTPLIQMAVANADCFIAKGLETNFNPHRYFTRAPVN
jgi:hypothetical protein